MKTVFSGCLKRVAQTQVWTFTRWIWRRFDETGILLTAGSLTFTTLLAIVPVLTVLLVAVTMFPAFADVVTMCMSLVNRMIVPSGAAAVADYLNAFKLQAGRLTALGIGLMLVSALMLVHTIEREFNRIWHVQQQRAWWVRLPAYFVLLFLVPLVAGLSVMLSSGLWSWLHWDDTVYLSGSLKMLRQLLLDTLALALLYRIVPNRPVTFVHAAGSALLTSILLESARWGFGEYVRHFHNYEFIYGAFAIVPIFLIWLNLFWTIVLTGALLTACLPDWHSHPSHQDISYPRFSDALNMLLLFAQAHADNRPLLPQDFRQPCNTILLQFLLENRYIISDKGGWKLRLAPEQIELSELFSLLNFSDSILPNYGRNIAQQSINVWRITLAQFQHNIGE